MPILPDRSRSVPWQSRTFSELDEFTQAYVEAALWSSLDESAGDDHPIPMDENHDVSDIDPETLAEMAQDCAKFQEQAGDMIADDLSQAGHDFWLSRNGHGAGFFDGAWENVEGFGDIGDELQDMASAFGEFTLYAGDDGKIDH